MLHIIPLFPHEFKVCICEVIGAEDERTKNPPQSDDRTGGGNQLAKAKSP
jgi:hypothetical protein